MAPGIVKVKQFERTAEAGSSLSLPLPPFSVKQVIIPSWERYPPYIRRKGAFLSPKAEEHFQEEA